MRKYFRNFQTLSVNFETRIYFRRMDCVVDTDLSRRESRALKQPLWCHPFVRFVLLREYVRILPANAVATLQQVRNFRLPKLLRIILLPPFLFLDFSQIKKYLY